MQRVCPSCGAENAPIRRFCNHCGAFLEATSDANVGPTADAPETETAAPAEKPKRKRRWLLLVGALVVLCLVAVAFIALTGDGGAMPTSPGERTVGERLTDFFASFNIHLPDFAAYFENVSTDVSTELDGIFDGLGRVAQAIVESITSMFQRPTR